MAAAHTLRKLLQHRRLVRHAGRPVTYTPTPDTRTGWGSCRSSRPAPQAAAIGPLPVLADSHQDAGCEQPNIQALGRDPYAVHVRGYWVTDTDLLLGTG
jgi:hypothetical protein